MSSKVSYAGQTHFPMIVVQKSEDGTVKARIETERLLMKSVKMKYLGHYVALLEEHSLASSKGLTPSQCTTYLIKDIWLKQLEEGNPYSSIAIFTKEKKEFVGHFVLSVSSPGRAMCSLLFHKEFPEEQYGREFIHAICEYAVFLKDKRYLVSGEPLKEVVFRPKTEFDITAVEEFIKEIRLEKRLVVARTRVWGATKPQYTLCLQEPV